MTMLQRARRQRRFLQHSLQRVWVLALASWFLGGGLLLCAADRLAERPVALRQPALAAAVDLSAADLNGAEKETSTDKKPAAKQQARRQAVRQRRIFSMLGLTRGPKPAALSRLPQVSAEAVKSEREQTETTASGEASPIPTFSIATTRRAATPIAAAGRVRASISDLADAKRAQKGPAPKRSAALKITPLPAVDDDESPRDEAPRANAEPLLVGPLFIKPLPVKPLAAGLRQQAAFDFRRQSLQPIGQTSASLASTQAAPAAAGPLLWPALRQPLHVAPRGKRLADKPKTVKKPKTAKTETLASMADKKTPPPIKQEIVKQEIAKRENAESKQLTEEKPRPKEMLAAEDPAENTIPSTELVKAPAKIELAVQEPTKPVSVRPAAVLSAKPPAPRRMKTIGYPKVTAFSRRQPLAEKSSVPLGPVRQTQFAQPRAVQRAPFEQELSEPELQPPLQQAPRQQAPLLAPLEQEFSGQGELRGPEPRGQTPLERELGEQDPLLARRSRAARKQPAQSQPFEIVDSTGDMQVQVRRSKLLIAKSNLFRTAVVDSSICDVVQYTPREASIIGKQVGATHVTFWFEGEDQRPITYLVTVTPDPQAAEKVEQEYMLLENLLARLFPDSKVQLLLAADKLIVRGQAKDAEEATQIMAIIRNQALGDGIGVGGDGGLGGSLRQGAAAQVLGDSETGGGQRRQIQVVNMLRVPGVQQVALRVKIAELNRSAARGFGVDIPSSTINLSSNNNGSQLVLQSILNAATGNAPALLTQFDGDDIQVGIRYLEQHGVLRLLSEPTLVTMSGQPATFVAGGEFAVPTVVGNAGLNAVTTDFRAFGVIISFLPTVVDKDRIRLQVAPEFSQINSDLSVGDTPGLNVRAVTTTVEMREGQTLAIAGLLEDTMQSDDANNVPFLSKVFGSRDTTRNETELIILVTPELIHPMEAEETPPLPGFDVSEPTNGQFFLGGRLEGTPTVEYRSTIWPRLKRRYKSGGSSMISGPFGHGQ